MSTRELFSSNMFCISLFFRTSCQVASFPWKRLSSSECQPTDMPPSCWLEIFQCEGSSESSDHEKIQWLWTQSQRYQIFGCFMPCPSRSSLKHRLVEVEIAGVRPLSRIRKTANRHDNLHHLSGVRHWKQKSLAFDFKISYFWIKEESKF